MQIYVAFEPSPAFPMGTNSCLKSSLQNVRMSEPKQRQTTLIHFMPGINYPYQIQHCFECILKLFLKTVFNLFCEIGFK